MGRSGTKLGQNFLVDDAATVRIADALGDVHDRTVVEIGPGHGAITAHLAERARRLHLVEFDPALARELAFRFRNQPHVTVHHGDILRTDLRPMLEAVDQANADAGASPNGTPNGSLDVVGNLPYYITSDILLHLFAAAREGFLRRAVVMTQREVADRVSASPGSSEFGALSALTQLHARVSPLFVLPPTAFAPPPDVYSTVFRLDFAPRFAEFGVEFEPFNRFLRASFAQKRKTLANNLRSAGFRAEQIALAWPPELPAQVRAEAVPIEALAGIYRALEAPAA